MNMRIRQSYRHVARGIALVCLASLAPACADASLPTALSPDPSSAQVVPAAIPALERDVEQQKISPAAAARALLAAFRTRTI